jgi:hypothetical protein
MTGNTLRIAEERLAEGKREHLLKLSPECVHPANCIDEHHIHCMVQNLLAERHPPMPEARFQMAFFPIICNVETCLCSLVYFFSSVILARQESECLFESLVMAILSKFKNDLILGSTFRRTLLSQPARPTAPISDRSPKFPGPKLAAATLLYEFCYDAIPKDQYAWKIRAALERYLGSFTKWSRQHLVRKE